VSDYPTTPFWYGVGILVVLFALIGLGWALHESRRARRVALALTVAGAVAAVIYGVTQDNHSDNTVARLAAWGALAGFLSSIVLMPLGVAIGMLPRAVRASLPSGRRQKALRRLGLEEGASAAQIESATDRLIQDCEKQIAVREAVLARYATTRTDVFGDLLPEDQLETRNARARRELVHSEKRRKRIQDAYEALSLTNTGENPTRRGTRGDERVGLGRFPPHRHPGSVADGTPGP
jgi:hypothetical protein